MTKPLTIGFLGGGLNSAIGRVHDIACRMDRRFDLAAGCFSRHDDMNRKTGDAWGLDASRVYTALPDMLAAEKNRVDAIAVLTPPDQHARQIIACLKAGFPVISEKPLAISAAETAAIRQALEGTNGFLAITYNYLAYPMMRELAAMIRAGKLGEIRQIQVEMPQEGYMRLNAETGQPFTPQEWRQHDYGVSTVSLDLGAHLHMFVHALTGEKPLSVAATGASYGNFHGLTDQVGCIAKYSNDLSVGMWFTKSALGHRNGLRVRVYGTEASAQWHQLEPEILAMSDRFGRHYSLDRGHPETMVANTERYTRFKVGHPAGFIEAFANCYYDIADALHAHKRTGRHDNRNVFGIEAGDEGLRLLEAMARAIETQSWADVT